MRVKTTAAPPWPGTTPSAAASNGEQRPDGESTSPAEAMYPDGCGVASEPATTIAASIEPAASAIAAWCTAISDDEQALCTASAGPVRPSFRATRAAAKAGSVPSSAG
ncbi:hypothetical protein MTP03_30510 [Tsukamurella sp. PLM1]|nr:hypothetical protein MTP03_30510 [Tsukamurella sp. PLM1]